MTDSDDVSRRPTRRSAEPPLSREDQRRRIRQQVDVVREQLGPDNVDLDTDDSQDPADFNFAFRSGAVLVRDRDLDRLSGVVPGEVRESLVDGVSLYQPRDLTTAAALERVDDALGIGVATPDHVLYVTPGTGGLCPANEPEEPEEDAPYPPPPSDGSADGEGVLVSVVDTGWIPSAAEHPRTPWLQGVTGDVEEYTPEHIRHYVGHGTFVAGVVRCLAPRAEVRVEGFLTKGGAVFESELVVQLNQALDRAPDIITMSAGTSSRLNRDLLGLRVFWETRLSQLKGTVLVAAAGNDGDRAAFWPAAFPWAISVGALDGEGRRAAFSNYGGWVDVYARGVDLVNAYPSGIYISQEPPHAGEHRRFDGLARWSGTSFATPMVAGLIAARMSRTGENARQAADGLLRVARENAVPGVGAVLGTDALN